MSENSKSYKFTHNTRFVKNASCSEDDAIRALLGDERGLLSDTFCEDERDTENAPLPDGVEEVSCLEAIGLWFDSAKTRYVNAKSQKNEEDIKQLYADLEEAKAELAKYRQYLCDIDDELAKGDASELKIDLRKTKSRQHPYITMRSLKCWAHKRYGVSIFANLPDSSVSQQTSNTKPRTKMLQQEDAILAEITRLGHNPESLPRNQPGKAGVKAEVCSALCSQALFAGSKNKYDSAWERLRGKELIKDA